MEALQDFYAIKGQRASPFEGRLVPARHTLGSTKGHHVLPLPETIVETGNHPTLVSRLGILQTLRNGYT
jgi:hypothetical protein